MRQALVLLLTLSACPRKQVAAVLSPDFIGGYMLETHSAGAKLLLLPDGRAQFLSMPGHHRVGGWTLEWKNHEGGVYFHGELPELLLPRHYLLQECDGEVYMFSPGSVGVELTCEALRNRDDLYRWRKVQRQAD